MKIRIKFTKQQLREMKHTQKIVAKKAKDPNFNKTIPEVEMKINRLGI